MKSLHLTIMVFCHVLLVSVVFILAASLASASPLVAQSSQPAQPQASIEKPQQSPVPQQVAAAAAAAVSPKQPELYSIQPAVAIPVAAPIPQPSPISSSPAIGTSQPMIAQPVAVKPAVVAAIPAALPVASPVSQPQPVASPPASKFLEGKSEVPAKKEEVSPVEKEAAPVQSVPEPRNDSVEKIKAPVEPIKEEKVAEKKQSELEPKKMPIIKEKMDKIEELPQPAASVAEAPAPVAPISVPVVAPIISSASVAIAKEQQAVEQRSQAELAGKPVVKKEEPSKVAEAEPKQQIVAQAAPVLIESVAAAAEKKDEQLQGKISKVIPAVKPVTPVNGGLGPLHLLASTLCSYHPDKPVAVKSNETVAQLYARREAVRKSLFEFMSLKFTNLEKLSSRLGYNLPVRSVPDPTATNVHNSNQQKPSHGWPVVGKCTAHDLKLMSEAAWCECYESDQVDCGKQQAATVPAADNQPVAEQKLRAARSIDGVDSFSPEQSSVMSKILHVGDVKDAPVVESTQQLYSSSNLTQQYESPTQECRRNALRYSKALFQHLAEDQQSQSESWPKLYSQISSDDCARKRMIDIVNALSSFRTDTTSIRRDNVEFAFAMDDLRTKVLESEVNVPLTFDRHFIEVEQFLQQSVRLMLAGVQPKRAKLTSMRYRSLMYGAAANIDEQQQCIDLHQRLLAKNYPSQCNPTEFGQLPDVLRMTANSLELWSIEKELNSLLASEAANYPSLRSQQKVQEDVNECVANLVAN